MTGQVVTRVSQFLYYLIDSSKSQHNTSLPYNSPRDRIAITRAALGVTLPALSDNNEMTQAVSKPFLNSY